MKKIIYVALFIFFGVLLSFLVHAAIEIPMITLLVKDYSTYHFGLSWNSWEILHNIGTIILLVLGIYFGLLAGRHYWKIIYES